MKLKIALLSIFITASFSTTALIVMLPEMALFLGENGGSKAKLFLTLPALVIIPFLLLSSYTIKLTNEKTAILVGLALYVISGLGGIISINEEMIMIFRVLTGVGAGLVIPYSGSLIAQFFTGREREILISYSGSVIYAAGAFIMLLSGWLVAVYWKLGFLVNLLSLIPIYLVYKYVPSIDKSTSRRKFRFIFNFIFKKAVYKSFIIYFCSMILLFHFFVSVTFLIVENKIGSSHEISMTQMLFMIAGIMSNFLIPYLKKRSLNLLFIFQLVCVTTSLMVLGLFNTSIIYIYLSSFIFGLGYGSIGILFVVIVSDNTSVVNRVTALSFLSVAMYLGQFLSPIVTGFLINTLDISSYGNLFLFEGIVFFIITVLAVMKMYARIELNLIKHFTKKIFNLNN